MSTHPAKGVTINDLWQRKFHPPFPKKKVSKLIVQEKKFKGPSPGKNNKCHSPVFSLLDIILQDCFPGEGLLRFSLENGHFFIFCPPSPKIINGHPHAKGLPAVKASIPAERTADLLPLNSPHSTRSMITNARMKHRNPVVSNTSLYSEN